MAKYERKKPVRDYYLEIVIRKTYKIKSSTKQKAQGILCDLNHKEDIAVENGEIEKIEDCVLKKRLLTYSENKLSKGKGTGKRNSW